MSSPVPDIVAVAAAATVAVTLTSHLGNHDVTLDADFYAQHGLSFHNQQPQSSEACLELLKNSPSITYLNHESAIVRLNGPGTTFKVFGSPYSLACGRWAFGYESTEEAFHLWNQIPLDTDVVVTHGPPKYHRDESKDHRAVGCEVLRQRLWRVRPRLNVCGHIHEGRGVDRILWDLHASNVKYKESNTNHWIDPGQDNAKQSLIDLTSQGGAVLEYETADTNEPTPVTEQHPQNGSSSRPTDPESTEMATSYRPTVAGTTVLLPSRVKSAISYTRGQGGIPPSGLCDMEALFERMGRKETCVINAAIKASSWTPKSSVARKFNQPIVVDVDLPVWRASADDISG